MMASFQNVKGLVERFTGDEVEVTKKTSAKSTDKQARKEEDKGKSQTSVEKVKGKESKVGRQDGPQNNKQQSGKQTDRDKSQQNDRRGENCA